MNSYITGLYRRIKEIQCKIETHQSKCKHINILKTPHSNTGNFDPNDDCYWYVCKCENCNKVWTENQ